MNLAVLNLAVNNTQVSAKMRETQGLFRGLDQKLRGSFGGFAKGAAALVGVASAGLLVAKTFGGLKSAFDLGGELSDVSAQTGVAVRDLVVLRQAFVNAGSGAEAVGPAINKLQKALAGVNEEGEPTNKVFARLGLNMERLRAMSPAQQFSAVSAAIAKIPDPATRAAAAMEIFGRNGGKLLTLFSDAGALGDAARQVGTQAEILNRNAALFDKISDTLGLVGTKVQGFFVGAADKLAPVLEPILDWFSGADLAGIGQRAGAAIAGVVRVLTDGTAWDAFGAGLVAVVQTSINSGWGYLRGLIVAAGAMVGETIKNALTLFSIVTRPSFWSGVGSALMAMAASFNALLLDGVAGLLDGLRNVPGIGGAVGKAADFTRAQADQQRAFAANDAGASADQLGPAFREYMQRLADTGSNVAEAFARGRDEAGQLIESANNDALLAGAVAKITATFADAASVKTGGGAEKPRNPLFDDGGTGLRAERDRPSAPRLMGIAGAGLFIKDPLAVEARRQIEEARRQTGLLQQVVKNTAMKPAAAGPLRFDF